jgi:hypothetical protein
VVRFEIAVNKYRGIATPWIFMYESLIYISEIVLKGVVHRVVVGGYIGW